MTSTRPPDIKVPYGAYYYREIPREDEELTHFGPGTPCGEYLRRFWQPVAFSADLKDVPKRIRIMGEDLVLFRDGRGQTGLLQLHCSHRGTSLEFGRISERGIRCCYHGWLYDVDGKVLEMPAEPPTSTYKDEFYHGAYPTFEYQGLIFAYMGPPDTRPEFPIYDTFVLPGYRFMGYEWWGIMPCNWLQVKENSMDPAHTAFLHAMIGDKRFASAFGEIGQFDWQETPIGMVYIHTRRVGENVWVRVSDFVPPNFHQFAPNWETGQEEKIFNRAVASVWAVPIDDTHTMSLGFRRCREGEEALAEESFRRRDLAMTADRPYEERQRRPDDPEAMVGQRPIAIHALEHLATSDLGVVQFRRLIRQGIQAVQRGEDPPGIVRTPGQIIPTYAQDTVLHIPPAPTQEEDTQLLREVGRKVVAGYYLKNPPAGVPIFKGDVG